MRIFETGEHALVSNLSIVCCRSEPRQLTVPIIFLYQHDYLISMIPIMVTLWSIWSLSFIILTQKLYHCLILRLHG